MACYVGVLLLAFFTHGAGTVDPCPHSPSICQDAADEEEEVSVVQTTLGSRHRVQAHMKRLDGNTTHARPRDSMGKPNDVNAIAAQTQDFTTVSFDPLGKVKIQIEKVSGMTFNSAGDLPEFLSALGLNLIVLCMTVMFFTIMYKRLPNVYAFRATGAGGQQEQVDAPHTWSVDERLPWLLWLRMSLKTTIDETIDTCGMDAAFLVRFTIMAMEMLAGLSVPGLCMLIPMYCYMGGNAAGDDKLSHLGIGNVQDGSWIFWLVALLVWCNVLFMQLRLFQWQRYFIKYRTQWLLQMPYPRSCTVMVECIVDKYCSDAALRSYFEEVYGEDEIRDAFVVKKLQSLRALIEEHKSVDQSLHEANFKQVNQDHIRYYESKKEELATAIRQEQKAARMEASKPPEETDIYATIGFVTFADRRNSEQALSTRLCVDEECLVMSTAPDPTDVIYSDLEMPAVERDLLQVIGYCLIAGLAIVFMPFVLCIAKLTDLDSLEHIMIAHEFMKLIGPLKETVKGTLAALGMTIMMSMLPTMLMWVFERFFYLKAHRWAQLELQRYYFWFLLVFVLLITTVGSSILATLTELMQSPMKVFQLLAERMPITAHFYMNYMCMQWAVHGLELTRYKNLIKYSIYSELCDAERARVLSEPEDQDYYGIGPRSARLSLLLITAIVFCTICPLILPLALITFGICRISYGYLLVFAEQRKADLGGNHWAQQLEHVHIGILIYIVLMTGILTQRVKSWGPATISASSLLCWSVLYHKCTRSLQWKNLSFEEVARERIKRTLSLLPLVLPKASAAYHQPELEDDALR